jgi:transcriptional regulator with XRE-family HTH domain
MYEVYCKLRDEKGVTDAVVSREAKVTKSTFTDWKNGRSKPKAGKLQRIADYFGVSAYYIENGKKEEAEFSKEQAQLDALITQDLELKEAIQKYMKLSDNKKSQVIEYINLIYGSEVNKK